MNDREDSFVMFKGNGFRFFHDGDAENQVVFNNIQSDTKVLVIYIGNKWCVMNSSNPKMVNRKNPIQKGEQGYGNSSYNPKNTMSNILYFNSNIENVIQWVTTNFEQYHKQFNK